MACICSGKENLAALENIVLVIVIYVQLEKHPERREMPLMSLLMCLPFQSELIWVYLDFYYIVTFKKIL